MSSLRPFKVTSASQINKYRRCNRKWWWNKIRGIREPTGAGAAYGTLVHNHMEAYFKDGVIPPVDADGEEGRSARDAQRLIDSGHYPTDVNPDHVEPKVWLTVPGMKRPVVGKVDVLYPKGNHVYDHKTLKHFRWMKTEQELLGDEQALIYGAVALQHGCTFPIAFSHVYVNTSDGRVKKVTAQITEEVLSDGWDALMETTEEMVNTAQISDPKEVPVNNKACGDYGGCPFKDRCMDLDNIGGTAGFAAKLAMNARNNKKDNKMGMTYEQMKARLNKPKTVVPTPVTTPPPQAEERLAQAKNVTPAPTGVGPGNAINVPSAADIQRGAGLAVNPPDGTPATEVVKPKVTGLKHGEQSYNGKALRSHKKDELVTLYPEVRQKMLESGKSKLWSARSTFKDAMNPSKGKRVDIRDDIALMLDILEGRITDDTAVPAPPTDPSPPAAPPTDPSPPAAPPTDPSPPTAPITGPTNTPLPWKVWRQGEVTTHPPLAELPEEPTVDMLRASFGPGTYALNYTQDNWQNASAKIVEVQGSDVTAEVQRALAQEPAIVRAAVSNERTLYVGCHPRGRTVDYLDNILVDVQKQVALDYGKDHYTMLDYGTGPKAVGAELARAVREGRLALPQALVVDRKHPCADEVLEVLMPHYQHIIERYG